MLNIDFSRIKSERWQWFLLPFPLQPSLFHHLSRLIPWHLEAECPHCPAYVHCPNVPTTSTAPMYLQHPLPQCTYNIHCPNVPTTSTAPMYLQHPLPPMYLQHPLPWCTYNIHCPHVPGSVMVSADVPHNHTLLVSFGRHAKSALFLSIRCLCKVK